MTSTLQQEGGRKLRLSAQQVMRVAQGLYERGYITYMRTDSTALSDTAIDAARSQVTSLFGQRVPVARRPASGRAKVKNAQEAHEAIRPAGDTFRTPAEVRGRAQQPRAPALRADLDAHAGLADGRRPRQDRERAGRRAVGRRARRRVRRRRHHHHLPGLPPGLRGGHRRGRRAAPATTSASCRRWPSATSCPSASSTPNGHATVAARPLHRGVAGEAARGARHRAPVDVGVHHPDHPRPRLRVEEGPGPGARRGRRSPS